MPRIVSNRKTVQALALVLAVVMVGASCAACQAQEERPLGPVVPEATTEEASGSYPASYQSSQANEKGEGASRDGESEGSLSVRTVKATTPSRGGAEVGLDEVRAAVSECHERKLYFDRFSGEAGECTTTKLALLTCSKAGIVQILTDAQKKQLQAALTASYQDWLIDQCIDCPPKGSSPRCLSDSGRQQVGTKVYFVKETDGELRGRNLLLPVRALPAGK